MLTVLIVDDEPLITRGVTLILKKSPHKFDAINIAYDGEEALGMIQAHIPDIIITDICMPRMDGLELCRFIHKKCPDTKLVVLSGHDEFDYAKTAMSYGVRHYLLKPIVRDELNAVINQIVIEIEKNRKESYISHVQMEEVANDMASALWGHNKNALFSAVHSLTDIIDLDNMLLSKNIYEDFVRLLDSKLSVKLGYQIRHQSEAFVGLDMLAFKKWIDQEMSKLNQEIMDRQNNSEFNALEISKKYLEENYNKDVSLSEIAMMIGFSPSYFSQLFKKNIGQTFVNYKLNLRLEKSKELLQCSGKSITQISEDVGFRDLTYFSRKFKGKYKMSPQSYRKEWNNSDS